jgi:hypothetical protein
VFIKIPMVPVKIIRFNLAEKILDIRRIHGLGQIFGGLKKQIDRLNPMAKPSEKPKEPPCVK